MNGGTCIDGVDNFTCSCPPKLTGALCECLILDDDSYDCEYVSPTLQPEYNRTTKFMTLYTDSTTVGSITTTDYTKNNTSTSTSVVTIPKSSTLITSSETSTVITSVPITAQTISTEISTITNMSKTDETDIITTTTGIPTVETETTTKINLTTETLTSLITQETLEIDNSKTETTTECGESCVKYNASTMNLPPDTPTVLPTDTSSSIAIIPRPTTESTLLLEETTTTVPTITTPTVKTTETETTTKTLTETTTKPSSETTLSAEIDTVTSSPEDDVHTDKMFTDIPVDVTNYVTSTVSSTEAMETTPGLDTTQTYPTIHSECTDFLCNNHGTCINGLHGVRVSIKSNVLLNV